MLLFLRSLNLYLSIGPSIQCSMRTSVWCSSNKLTADAKESSCSLSSIICKLFETNNNKNKKLTATQHNITRWNETNHYASISQHSVLCTGMIQCARKCTYAQFHKLCHMMRLWSCYHELVAIDCIERYGSSRRSLSRAQNKCSRANYGGKMIDSEIIGVMW